MSEQDARRRVSDAMMLVVLKRRNDPAEAVRAAQVAVEEAATGSPELVVEVLETLGAIGFTVDVADDGGLVARSDQAADA